MLNRTLSLKRDDAPKAFKITVTGSHKGARPISFTVQALDAKSAVREAQRSIQLGKYTVEPA